MAITWPRTDLPQPITTRRAGLEDRHVLERLWLLFRHDMSSHTRTLPDPDGTYRPDRLRAALGEPGGRSWLLLAGARPIGLALARGTDGPVPVLPSLFLVAPVRRAGLGTAFARTVITDPPATWTVAHQEANLPAARFWCRLAALVDPAWRIERRPVPGRPELPPDAWVTFDSRQ